MSYLRYRWKKINWYIVAFAIWILVLPLSIQTIGILTENFIVSIYISLAILVIPFFGALIYYGGKWVIRKIRSDLISYRRWKVEQGADKQ